MWYRCCFAHDVRFDRGHLSHVPRSCPTRRGRCGRRGDRGFARCCSTRLRKGREARFVVGHRLGSVRFRLALHCSITFEKIRFLFGIFWMVLGHTRSSISHRLVKKLDRDCGTKTDHPFTSYLTIIYHHPPLLIFRQWPLLVSILVPSTPRYLISNTLYPTFIPNSTPVLSRSAWPGIVVSTLSPTKCQIVKHRTCPFHPS